MRIVILIFLINFSWLAGTSEYRLNCDPCISQALCQQINSYLKQIDHTKIVLAQLAEQLQTRFTSLEQVQVTKSWAGQLVIQAQALQPVYLIDLPDSDRVYVLAQARDGASSAVPALWFNPTCLENLPAVCFNGQRKRVSRVAPAPFDSFALRVPRGRSKSATESNLNLPAEFAPFWLGLDPVLRTSFKLEWRDRNQIILHYCPVAVSYSCKLVVRASSLTEQAILTPQFLARCLNLLPAELFTPASNLGNYKITGATNGGPNSTHGQLNSSKIKAKNFTLDLRFKQQIVILND